VEYRDAEFTKGLVRNLAIALPTTFAVTLCICWLSVQDVGLALQVAAWPAMMAGPYAALLVTCLQAVARAESRSGAIEEDPAQQDVWAPRTAA
jgi:hypothetical protein